MMRTPADNRIVPSPNGLSPRKKSSWSDLAIFGGEPAFAEPLHVGRPHLPDRAKFERAMDRIWDSRLLSNNGPFVQELEARFAEMAGTRHAIATCNATLALQLVARGLDLRGEVILPSFTFIATAHAFRWEGLTPVFADVDPQTHCLDPDQLESLITDDTAAIAGVHLWGNVCDVERLEALAKKYGLYLLFDAAHALGSSGPCGRIGAYGDAEVFSLHATKIVSGFEGGMVTTNSDLLAHHLRSLRNFGFAGYDDVRGIGTNAKMSEPSAAMALCGLDDLDSAVAHNRANLDRYRSVFQSLNGIQLVEPADPRGTNAQYIVLDIDEREAGMSRDRLMEALWGEGVRARRYFHPGCHLSEPYRWECRDAAERLPVTDELSRRLLVLPTGTSVGEGEIRAVGAIFEVCHAASRRLNERDLASAA